MIEFQKLSIFELFPAVDEAEIEKTEERMGLIIPNAYKQLLQYTNGFVTDEGVIIFGIDINGFI